MNAWKKLACAFLTLLVLGLAPLGSASAQVKVTSATPASAYQGTLALDVVVGGSGFDPSAKVAYFVSGTTNPGGITVRKIAYRNSKELVTTIDVAATADLSSFDIVVTLSSGRKGKGTTLFSVQAKARDPAPAPTYPAGRFWHAFASNGGTTAATSRLYMFAGSGGAQLDWVDLGDLWVYTNAGGTAAKWTYVQPGSEAPGPRVHVGWSCGGGRCVTSNGRKGGILLYETWVFTETTGTWTQVTCSRRSPCPSARIFPTMAYNPLDDTHVLFGGSDGRTPTNDTHVFSPARMKWTNHGSGSVPSPRSWSAAVFVPPMGRIVLIGGYQDNVRALNDMYAWNGSAWSPIQQTFDSTLTAVPALLAHSAAWDPAGGRVIVTSGILDMDNTPNRDTFYVTFSNQGGSWRANWTRASGIGCQAAVTSPPDPEVHPETRMAFDATSGVQVFFGGVENLPGVGAWAYDNTVECR